MNTDLFTIETAQQREGTAPDYATAARTAQRIANEKHVTVVASMYEGAGTRFYFYPQV